jgi:hypothetical protein
VTPDATKPNIPESFLEHRQIFANPWVDRWTVPNPFIATIFPLLKSSGAELTDITSNKDAANVGDNYVNFAITKLNAAIRVGLDHLTFLVGNPDWSMAPQLVELFDAISERFKEFVDSPPATQRLTLAFHVTAGDISLREKTSHLINGDRLGEADFFGISLYRENYSVVIDKSMRHDKAAYIRIQRTFDGQLTFAEIAPQLYEDEANVLALLDIAGID